MPKLKLIYFDFDGGRGEVARLAMHIGGVPFEDHRVDFPTWKEMRDQMPFKQVPVVEVDGKLVTQCNAINRYVGKLGGLYPRDDRDALACDEVMDAVEDIAGKMANTIPMQGDAQKAAREALATGPLPLYLGAINKMLQDAGGEYFVGGALSVADIKVALWIRWLRSGAIDHMPADLPDQHAPELVKLFDRVMAHPKVVEWYAKRKAA